MRDRFTALFLAILLGNFGIHRFYIGKIGTGIIMLLLCWTGISLIWTIIDIIMIARDDFDELGWGWNWSTKTSWIFFCLSVILALFSYRTFDYLKSDDTFYNYLGYFLLVFFVAAVVVGSFSLICIIIFSAKKALKTEKKEKPIREASICNAINVVTIAKNKSDAIVSSIKNAEKTFASPKAKKTVEEAAIEASKSALALERAFTIAENAKGKSSKGTLKSVRQAEKSSMLSEKDVDAVNNLYDQAVKEEKDWGRLQKEANDAMNKAKNAADNATREASKVEKTTFVSAVAKDATEKAVYAAAKAKEAAKKTVIRREAAASATSSQDAQMEVSQAKNSEKRAIVEEKIAVEEAKIAIAFC